MTNRARSGGNGKWIGLLLFIFFPQVMFTLLFILLGGAVVIGVCAGIYEVMTS